MRPRVAILVIVGALLGLLIGYPMTIGVFMGFYRLQHPWHGELSTGQVWDSFFYAFLPPFLLWLGGAIAFVLTTKRRQHVLKCSVAAIAVLALVAFVSQFKGWEHSPSQYLIFTFLFRPGLMLLAAALTWRLWQAK
ncbi:hypothetical protein [Roseateles koreensis]|uniref:Transmembrane protein n=1 Tax=Roseateles koreensis TaxID=2987526 RepID=A0ABT5KPT8_9BURK|nr:hypothetical protein [Roseateles koreensis]MDC8784934.1 hypothetical protein [Roseateles koreensis]